ncbi:hypothetical protein [Microviridae sp.]|nr:hypothetical protein [Microviridae sp.]
MTTKKQSKPSKTSSTELNNRKSLETAKQMPLKLNLVHALFIHGITSELFHDSDDYSFKNFLHDIIILHENVIESSSNEQLKEKMNYKPFNPEQHETQETNLETQV